MSAYTFIDLCVQGKVHPEQIEDYIDMWHNSNTNTPIFTYLGLTHKEYKEWVKNPNKLENIIKTRKIC